MKCKIFEGRWYEAVDAFNKWAKDKTLNSQVIIHTHGYYNKGQYQDSALMILVFHPSTQRWDKTEQ